MNYYKDLISDSLKIKNNSYKDIKKFQLNEIFEYNGKNMLLIIIL